MKKVVLYDRIILSICWTMVCVGGLILLLLLFHVLKNKATVSPSPIHTSEYLTDCWKIKIPEDMTRDELRIKVNETYSALDLKKYYNVITLYVDTQKPMADNQYKVCMVSYPKHHSPWNEVGLGQTFPSIPWTTSMHAVAFTERADCLVLGADVVDKIRPDPILRKDFFTELTTYMEDTFKMKVSFVEISGKDEVCVYYRSGPHWQPSNKTHLARLTL